MEARARMDSRISSWQLLDELFAGTRQDLRATSAEEALHTLAVTLEDALSRWFINSIRQNGVAALETASRDIQKKAETAARDEAAEQGLTGAQYRVTVQVQFDQASKLYAADVEKFLDKSGMNLTFKSHVDWNRKAGRLLDEPFKAAAHTVTEDDWALIELTKKLRNYVAHRSDMSKTFLEKAVTDIRRGRGPHALLCWSGTKRFGQEDGKRAGDFLVRETSDDRKKVLEVVEERLSALLEKLAVD